jgi:AAA+ superfamily predicted ATPase
MAAPIDQAPELSGLLSRLATLKRLLAAGNATRSPPPQARASCPALQRLDQAFGLGDFESDVLVLCAGLEIDPEVAQLCAKAQGNPARTAPTFGLLLGTLPGAHWSAIGPSGALRRWRLIEVGAEASLTQAPLRLDERILHFLLGSEDFDERLATLLAPLPPALADRLPPSHQHIVDQIAESWLNADRDTPLVVVQLCGARADCRPIAAAAARRLGLGAASIFADRLPSAAADLENLARLWERESVLSSVGVLVVEAPEAAVAEVEAMRTRASALAMLDRLSGPIILRDHEARRLSTRASLSFDVQHPLPDEQRALWRAQLRQHGRDDEIAETVAQFRLASSDIAAIGGEAYAARNRGDDAPLWDLCRRRMRGALEGLAQRVETSLAWDDIVLPEPQKQTLRVIALQLRQRGTVYDDWGFGERSRRGQGVNALFHGPSGAGKTMAAEVLANALNLDLYHIDLSRLISKYIGETEDHLRRVFDAAEDNGAILLFDEADSLFGKRSEVKDSHDRYANIEVSYLLQRMEAYRGLAILTTNMRAAIDPAFLRRLRFSVAFPFPDEQQRAEIWRRAFPPATRTQGLDHARLAQLLLTGGNISNIAVSAAFLAADAGEPVQMRHVREAVEAEFAKLDRRPTQAERLTWS